MKLKLRKNVSYTIHRLSCHRFFIFSVKLVIFNKYRSINFASKTDFIYNNIVNMFTLYLLPLTISLFSFKETHFFFFF